MTTIYSTKRIVNFNAGPAALPLSVLQIAQSEMPNYQNTGMSVLEMSHRSKEFEKILKDASDDLRKLLHLPVNYKILFLQGGASLQFSAVPLNFINNKQNNQENNVAA